MERPSPPKRLRFTLCTKNPNKRKRDHDAAAEHAAVRGMSDNSEGYQMDRMGCVIRARAAPGYCSACGDTAAWVLTDAASERPVCTRCAHGALP